MVLLLGNTFMKLMKAQGFHSKHTHTSSITLLSNSFGIHTFNNLRL